MPDTEASQAFLESAVTLVRDLRKMFDARAKSLDLTYSRARALSLIAQHEGMTQTALAAALDIETPSVKRLLDGLETSGYVVRRAAAKDRRVNEIFLTEMARGRAQSILSFRAEMRAQILSGISEDDLRTTVETLNRAIRNASGRDPS